MLGLYYIIVFIILISINYNNYFFNSIKQIKDSIVNVIQMKNNVNVRYVYYLLDFFRIVIQIILLEEIDLL